MAAVCATRRRSLRRQTGGMRGCCAAAVARAARASDTVEERRRKEGFLPFALAFIVRPSPPHPKTLLELQTAPPKYPGASRARSEPEPSIHGIQLGSGYGFYKAGTSNESQALSHGAGILPFLQIGMIQGKEAHGYHLGAFCPYWLDLRNAGDVSRVAYLVIFLSLATQSGSALFLRRYPLSLLESGFVALAAGFLLQDWRSASQLGDRDWPMCVIVLDALLVGDARDWAARAVIALVLAWLAVEKAERATRYRPLAKIVTGPP
eukprot:gene12592-biopygen3902